MAYKNWKMNIKHLTEFLMSYVSAAENNNTEEIERLTSEITIIFNRLHSDSEEDKKEEIINLILLKMQEKTLTHFEVATYTRELVVYGVN